MVRCLSSIKNMFLKDIEVLMIDDGSSDASSTICKDYESSDNRFYYYFKQNGGVSSARNYGLSLAHGEWITFIDSDDWVLPNHFSFLNNNMSTEALYVTGVLGIDKFSENNIIETTNHFTKINTANLSEYFRGKITKNPIYLVTNKCFSKKIISDYNIMFKDDVSIGEDQIFLDCYLLHILNIYYSDEHTYIQWCGTLGSLTISYRNISDNYHCIREVFKSLISLSFSSKNFTVLIYALNYLITRIWKRVIKQFIKKLIERK